MRLEVTAITTNQSNIKLNQDHNMSTVTENDLKQLKDLITQLSENQTKGFTRIDEKFAQVNEKMNKGFEDVNKQIAEVRVSQAEIKTRLNDWKPSIDKTADLSEKVGELKNWKQIGIILITGLITSLFWIFNVFPKYLRSSFGCYTGLE